ncbi:hypothetical protein CAI21_02835 [Alkalilimnicola ehrlichii]|uniref:Uncharacterized protein n=1 Tax=Alkalilimnicola ehrlichii TaxID=351052 RepID=A0A3E0X228_9GAMM|nr:hypothetical protein [Alkalilimnicola ehrlichii]RFA30929.1 hypothetical protein CAI21_02835 [Alkalilimnicola ehrlichii]RFA38879.1 hypothetical protein CAL65_02970 [Alkalilimnicola ehrlichii]
MTAARKPSLTATRSRLRRTMRSGIGLIFVCALSAVGAEPASAPPPRVQDLHFGTVLFDFYRQDHFAALTELMTAQQQERFDYHRNEAELLRGGLKLGYGLHDEAEGIFRRLLTRDVPPVCATEPGIT